LTRTPRPSSSARSASTAATLGLVHRRLDVQGNEHQPLADLLRPLVGQDEGAAPAVDLGDVRPTIPLNAPGDREPTGHAALLAWSWVTLAAAITSTMVSFVISQMAIDRQLDLATQYYLHKKDEALTANNKPAEWTVRLNWCAGLAFGIGVALTVWFAVLSIPTR